MTGQARPIIPIAFVESEHYLSHTMLIEEKKLKHWIDHFYGYGSWHAPIWFIAHEESGGEVPEEVADKINYFATAHTGSATGVLCDIRELYQHVSLTFDGPKAHPFPNRYEYRFGMNAVLHGLWKNLIAFSHGYRGEKVLDLLEYQKQAFASSTPLSEALVNLFPLPGPHSHAWYYGWLDLPQLTFLKRRDLYEEHVYAHRMHTILSNIRNYKPAVVLMYGMNNILSLKKSVQEFFDGVHFKMIKATRQQIPQHHRADVNGTTVVITTQIPALRHRRIETGFDWEQFGKSVKKNYE